MWLYFKVVVFIFRQTGNVEGIAFIVGIGQFYQVNWKQELGVGLEGEVSQHNLYHAAELGHTDTVHVDLLH